MSTVLLLSDVHANLVALEAVLADAGPADATWVTGDTVGYGPDPSDVLALLRERHAVLVAGNHDLAVGTGAGLELFNPHAAEAARMHRSWLAAEERDHLASLPLTHEAEGFTLCHGSLRDPVWEYVVSGAQARATLDLAKTAHCCHGHTHVPAVFRSDGRIARHVDLPLGRPLALDGRYLINPGSVGQPRDGDPRAAYAVLDTHGGSITFRRATYDVATTQRRIRSRGLPDLLADRLSIGY